MSKKKQKKEINIERNSYLRARRGVSRTQKGNSKFNRKNGNCWNFKEARTTKESKS